MSELEIHRQKSSNPVQVWECWTRFVANPWWTVNVVVGLDSSESVKVELRKNTFFPSVNVKQPKSLWNPARKISYKQPPRLTEKIENSLRAKIQTSFKKVRTRLELCRPEFVHSIWAQRNRPIVCHRCAAEGFQWISQLNCGCEYS